MVWYFAKTSETNVLHFLQWHYILCHLRHSLALHQKSHKPPFRLDKLICQKSLCSIVLTFHKDMWYWLSVRNPVVNLQSKFSVRETLRNFIGHLVLLGETFHRTELISVWLWVYIVYIVLEATSEFQSSWKWGKSDRSHICPAGPTVRWIWQTLQVWLLYQHLNFNKRCL